MNDENNDIPDKASPRPWSMRKAPDECRFWVIDNPDGVSIATAWREPDAALIVQAVNERDALRDLADRIEAALKRERLARLAAVCLHPTHARGQ